MEKAIPRSQGWWLSEADGGEGRQVMYEWDFQKSRALPKERSPRSSSVTLEKFLVPLILCVCARARLRCRKPG